MYVIARSETTKQSVLFVWSALLFQVKKRFPPEGRKWDSKGAGPFGQGLGPGRPQRLPVSHHKLPNNCPMGSRNMRSAASSLGVADLLMSTSRLPR